MKIPIHSSVRRATHCAKHVKYRRLIAPAAFPMLLPNISTSHRPILALVYPSVRLSIILIPLEYALFASLHVMTAQLRLYASHVFLDSSFIMEIAKLNVLPVSQFPTLQPCNVTLVPISVLPAQVISTVVSLAVRMLHFTTTLAHQHALHHW